MDIQLSTSNNKHGLGFQQLISEPKLLYKDKEFDLVINYSLLNCVVKNGMYDTKELRSVLNELLRNFVLARIEVADLIKAESFSILTERALSKLKKKNNSGEVGELLLFLILELFLNSPKILSKYSLKTNSEEYVKGYDAVHYMKNVDGSFSLVFGESKTYDDLVDGSRDAFDSLGKFIRNRENNKDSIEDHLVESNITKEFRSEKEQEFIAKLLIPSKKSGVKLSDDILVIFIVFEISPQIFEVLTNQGEEPFKEKIEEYINEKNSTIKNHIKRKGNECLARYKIKFITLPFYRPIDSRQDELGVYLFNNLFGNYGE